MEKINTLEDRDSFKDKRNLHKKKMLGSMKKFKSLELLNFEGPVLMCYKLSDHFIILDQWNVLCCILSSNELLDFINGESNITDSEGKEWSYLNESHQAKPSIKKLLKFMNS